MPPENENLENEIENEEELENEQEEQEEASEEEQEQTEESASSEEPETKKIPWFQKRLNDITAKNRDILTQNENLKRQLADALEGKLPATEEEINKRAKAEAARIAQQTDFDRRCNEAADKGSAEFTDFTDAVTNLGAAGAFDSPLIGSVLELDEPHKMLYKLGKDPELAERLMNMTPAKQAIELARMEAAARTPKPKQISKAPPPITPVTTGNTKAKIDLNDEEVPMADWLAERNRQLESRHRR